MDSYVIWEMLEGVTRLGIAGVELLCAAVLIFRFRAHLLRALPLVLGLLFYVFADSVSGVFTIFRLGGGGATQWIFTGINGCAVLAAIAIAVGFVTTGTAKAVATAAAPSPNDPTDQAGPAGGV